MIFSKDGLLLQLTLHIVTNTVCFPLDFQSFICLMAATPKRNGGRYSIKPAFLLRYRIDSRPKAGVLAAKRLYDSQAPYPFPVLARRKA